MAMQKNKTKLKIHISEDIILKFLHRLPVKSLLRFKCVSKWWHSIISDPQFAKSHLKLASEQQTLKRRLLFSRDSHFDSLDLENPWFGDDSSLRNLACRFKQPDEYVKVIGSCNGLVCLALTLEDSAKFYIWNPSTAFYWRIPDYTNFVSNLCMLWDCGFGYISSTDDYKLTVGATSDEGTLNYFFIFSSRANSWKSIDNPPFVDFNFDRPAVLSNEALHWIRESRADILAFDLANEDYHELSLPIDKYTASNNACFLHLGVLPDGCLCAMCFMTCNGSDWTEFWVMREYGVSESWAKFFKFEIGNIVLGNDAEEDLFYPVYMENGRVVAECTNPHFFPRPDIDLEVYNQLIRLDCEEDGLDSVVEFSGQYSLKGVQSYAIMYEESLLVLNDHHQA